MSSQSHFTRTLAAMFGALADEHDRHRRRRRSGAGECQLRKGHHQCLNSKSLKPRFRSARLA